MTEYTFEQLIDVDQVRQLLESHHQLSGMAYGLFDNNENDIVSAGWQDICTRFHRVHPVCSTRCRESNAFIKAHLRDVKDDYLEYRCGNGMIDVAMPIVIEGRHLATFFVGQFFYDDDPPDRAFFLAQAREFGFDPDDYLAALERVPLFCREHIRANVIFLCSMVRILAESGLKSLELASEIKKRKLFEEQYALSGFALDQVHEAAFLMDTSGRFQYVNQEACRSLGFSKEELLGMAVPDIDPDYSAEVMAQSFERLLEQGTQTYETHHRARDGRIFPVEITSTLVEHDGAGYALALVRDISERKRMEEQLQQALEFSEGVVNAIPDLLFEIDREARYLNVWAPKPELLVAPKEVLLGKTVHDTLSPESAAIVMDSIREANEKGLSFGKVIRIDLPQGTSWFELSTSRKPGGAGADIRFLVMSRDITERRRVEEQLRFREQQFRTLAENSPGMIIRYDHECRRVYVNPAFTRETGIDIETALGAPPENVWMNDANVTSHEYTKLLRRVMETAAPAEILLEWPNRDTGRLSSHLVHIVVERDADGDINGCLAIDHDITRLRETELKLAKLAENSPGVMYTLRMKPDGTICMPYASPRFKDLHGLHPEDVVEDMSKAFALVHPDDIDGVRESMAEAARTFTSWRYEFRVLHPAKGEIWLEGHASPEPEPDGGILWYGFLHDITGRKQSEEVLLTKRAQLAALAAELSLAEERERQNIAAVLHDHIGQTLLLGRIKLGTLAEEQMPESHNKMVGEAKELLDQVTHDIHTLTVQMNPPILAAVGLEAALEWLGRRMEEDYGLFVEFEDDLEEKPLLDEVRSVVYQCGRELLINVAKHANTDHARIVLGREDDRYRLTVEDDGAGFDPADLVPNASRDCRFGLLSIQIRIERMGGSVVFESAPGQGSRMTLLAPLALNGSKRKNI